MRHVGRDQFVRHATVEFLLKRPHTNSLIGVVRRPPRRQSLLSDRSFPRSSFRGIVGCKRDEKRQGLGLPVATSTSQSAKASIAAPNPRPLDFRYLLMHRQITQIELGQTVRKEIDGLFIY